MRALIVNADDFGQSAAVNAGIVAAHEHGIVTSTSLMVRWPHAGEAAEAALGHPSLDVGLHLDFGEWALRDGSWEPLYTVVALDDEAGVEEEVARQLEAFERLTGRGPTHLDSHQHVHLRSDALLAAATDASRARGIPLRRCGRITYRGDFYGQAEDGSSLDGVLTVAGLAGILASLEDGVSELACHPAAGDDLETMYGGELRERELEVLCDPEVREVLAREEIVLSSFSAVGAG